MTLVRWNPYRTLNSLERELNHFLGDYTGALKGGSKTDWYPSAQIVEQKATFEVSLELPGVKKEDVSINLEDAVLTIKGEKKSEKEVTEDNYTFCERHFGSFERSFNLPNTVNTDGIKAVFENGVLSISIPKAEQAQPKSIQIQ